MLRSDKPCKIRNQGRTHTLSTRRLMRISFCKSILLLSMLHQTTARHPLHLQWRISLAIDQMHIEARLACRVVTPTGRKKPVQSV